MLSSWPQALTIGVVTAHPPTPPPGLRELMQRGANCGCTVCQWKNRFLTSALAIGIFLTPVQWVISPGFSFQRLLTEFETVAVLLRRKHQDHEGRTRLFWLLVPECEIYDKRDSVGTSKRSWSRKLRDHVLNRSVTIESTT